MNLYLTVARKNLCELKQFKKLKLASYFTVFRSCPDGSVGNITDWWALIKCTRPQSTPALVFSDVQISYNYNFYVLIYRQLCDWWKIDVELVADISVFMGPWAQKCNFFFRMRSVISKAAVQNKLEKKQKHILKINYIWYVGICWPYLE